MIKKGVHEAIINKIVFGKVQKQLSRACSDDFPNVRRSSYLIDGEQADLFGESALSNETGGANMQITHHNPAGTVFVLSTP